jgi:hypothetical protein
VPNVRTRLDLDEASLQNETCSLTPSHRGGHPPRETCCPENTVRDVMRLRRRRRDMRREKERERRQCGRQSFCSDAACSSIDTGNSLPLRSFCHGRVARPGWTFAPAGLRTRRHPEQAPSQSSRTSGVLLFHQPYRCASVLDSHQVPCRRQLPRLAPRTIRRKHGAKRVRLNGLPRTSLSRSVRTNRPDRSGG